MAYKNMIEGNKKHVYLLGILLVLVGMFYWFQLRPSSARKDCLVKVDQLRKERTDPKNFVTNEEANNFYRRCFIEKGHQPEDLVK